MGYFALWLFFTVFLLAAPYYSSCQIIDFIFKYNKKNFVKCSKIIINYPFKIDSNKPMKDIYFKETAKCDIRYVSRECFIFQLINYIYFLFTFIIMILNIVLKSTEQIQNLYRFIIKIDCVYFIILIIFSVLSYALIKKPN